MSTTGYIVNYPGHPFFFTDLLRGQGCLRAMRPIITTSIAASVFGDPLDHGLSLTSCELVQSCHVLVMQKILFEYWVTDLQFSYKGTLFSSGTFDGMPFELKKAIPANF